MSQRGHLLQQRRSPLSDVGSIYLRAGAIRDEAWRSHILLRERRYGIGFPHLVENGFIFMRAVDYTHYSIALPCVSTSCKQTVDLHSRHERHRTSRFKQVDLKTRNAKLDEILAVQVPSLQQMAPRMPLQPISTNHTKHVTSSSKEPSNTCNRRQGITNMRTECVSKKHINMAVYRNIQK